MSRNALSNPKNELGLTIGFEVENWTPAESPNHDILRGRYCRCEPLNIERHSDDLFDAYQQDSENRNWVYLPYGPFDTILEYQDWMVSTCFNGDPFFYAIVDSITDKAIGVASYLRIDPANGVIEVGHINYAPALQGTVAATEAMYLMTKNVFDLGNRRYEWKCNALNDKSCHAALRLGFTYEGIFRQMFVVKGRNRDTAWYSMLDREWPVIERAFKTWLMPENFDRDGKQIAALSELTKQALGSI